MFKMISKESLSNPKPPNVMQYLTLSANFGFRFFIEMAAILDYVKLM